MSDEIEMGALLALLLGKSQFLVHDEKIQDQSIRIAQGPNRVEKYPVIMIQPRES